MLVIYLPDCHESIAGIIAGRVRERYHRPVYVLTRKEGVKGSGRSIEGYSMYEELVNVRICWTSLAAIRWRQDAVCSVKMWILSERD